MFESYFTISTIMLLLTFMEKQQATTGLGIKPQQNLLVFRDENCYSETEKDLVHSWQQCKLANSTKTRQALQTTKGATNMLRQHTVLMQYTYAEQSI